MDETLRIKELERDLAILIEAIRDECEIPEGIRQALLKVTGGIVP